MIKLAIAAVSVLALIQPLAALTPAQASIKVAEAAGVNGFDQVQRIKFTFNVDLGDKKIIRRWDWQPQDNRVTLIESDKVNLTYHRGGLDENSDKKVLKADSQFVNDSYWLLFPLKVVWDDTVEVVAIPDEARVAAAGEHKGFRIKYPEKIGYTPGDVYDVYYDKDFTVTHWAYFPGGAEAPKVVTEWTDYKDKGPLKISMNRPAPDKPFRVWFTDVTVESSE
jgi:hypothetical protein